MWFVPGMSDLPWTTILAGVTGLYAVGALVFILLENRSPQSTIAWLLLFLLLPPLGLVIYVMFGRSWKAFSRHDQLLQVLRGTSFAIRARAVVERQPAEIGKLLQGDLGDYARLAPMLWASGRAPLTSASGVQILQDASEKYPCLLADLEQSSRSIHLLYYEWSSDPFTEDVLARLAEKVASGVEVRILYDPVGSLRILSRRYVRRARAAGVRMEPFSPLWRLHTISYRNHRKIAVLDGRMAYSGGLNMSREHLTGPSGFTGWRDTHARVTGAAALALQAVFATMWHNATGESLFESRYFPEPDAAMGASASLVPVQVVSSGPDSEWATIRRSYAAMIALAREHVFIQSPFLIPDQGLAETLKTAALAGVDVRVMIAPRGPEGQLAYRAGLTYAVDLVRAGVRVLLYEGEYFHPKTITVDSRLCSIGSANMDVRSFSINYETNLVVYDAPVTRELEAAFERDQARCREFSAEAYGRRSFVSRLVDSTMRVCSPLL
jgi:cardiolipin synthase